MEKIAQIRREEAILSRRGRHAVLGEISVEYVLRRIYQHEREHAAEVRQALKEE